MKATKRKGRYSLGKIEFGHEMVQLLVDHDLPGGWYKIFPVEHELAVICIGLATRDWKDITTVLIHEAMEFALERRFCKFKGSTEIARDSGGCIFVFDHAQFTDACARAGEFVATATPLVQTEFRRMKK